MGLFGESLQDWLKLLSFCKGPFKVLYHALKFFWAMLGQWFEVASVFGELGFGKTIKGICSLNMSYGFVVLQKLGVKLSDFLLKEALQPAI